MYVMGCWILVWLLVLFDSYKKYLMDLLSPMRLCTIYNIIHLCLVYNLYLLLWIF